MDNNFEKRKKVIYDFICDEFYVSMKLKEIAIILQVPKEQRKELKEVLDSLIGEGKVRLTQKGKYMKGESGRIVGVYQAHPKGFGFVMIEGEQEDIFIGEEESGGALQGDTVAVVLLRTPEGKRKEGKIVEILSRGTTHVVGLYEKKDKKNFGFVRPDNPRFCQDIFIAKENSAGAMDGHKVVVRLLNYGDKGRKPEGRIEEILGHKNDPGMDILSIVKGYDLPVEFPEKVLNQAGRVPDEISEADMQGRKDIRSWSMVTIDGEDAKDLDDAVSLTWTEDQFILGVHIADVSNYVQERSALDREALKRGTSVYLADRVIPMLPHRLSNGICSLNEGADRLALSCIMTIDRLGNVTDHEIAETVICVNKRMSYTQVKEILSNPSGEEAKKQESLVPMLEQMSVLSGILRKKRHKRGAIDFDFPEAKLRLDEKGKPIEILPYDRNVATKMIEDFMLLANETVAEDYYWQELPFVYRTHEAPDEEKIRKFAIFINNFGYSMHVGHGEIHPKEVQKLLEKLEGKPEEDLISRLALRSMRQAKYSPENAGHFGLAASYYTHFTSPIRRYPDLQIHRIIKDNLRGRMNEKKIEHYASILPEVTRQASETERKADEAERATIKLKKAEFMQSHIGEVYEGIISGMTKWGMYVELDNTVEGLIHVASMREDHYEYYEERCEMAGLHTGKVYRLGQKVYVKVVAADRMTRTIDFEIVEKGDFENGEDQ